MTEMLERGDLASAQQEAERAAAVHEAEPAPEKKSVKERPVYARNSLEKWQRENPATFDASSRETGSVQ